MRVIYPAWNDTRVAIIEIIVKDYAAVSDPAVSISALMGHNPTSAPKQCKTQVLHGGNIPSEPDVQNREPIRGTINLRDTLNYDYLEPNRNELYTTR